MAVRRIVTAISLEMMEIVLRGQVSDALVLEPMGKEQVVRLPKTNKAVAKKTKDCTDAGGKWENEKCV